MLKSRLLPALVLVLLLGTAIGAEVLRDAAYGEPRPEQSVLYIRSGDFLKRASLSNASLLADLYWIRSVQYYGSTHRSTAPGKSYDLLYPLLDITTTLDPYFRIAYRFGSIFVAEPYPDGPGRIDLAIKLLDKGIRTDNKWQYWQDRGFVYYWYAHDYRKAGEAFERGARAPGAPWWIESMAAVMFANGGDRRTSRLLWQELARTPDNEWLSKNAAWRLQQLDALDQIGQLERLVALSTRRTGTPPASWDALVASGWLSGVPIDPTGVPYVLDPATGHVNVGRNSSLFPLPGEP